MISRFTFRKADRIPLLFIAGAFLVCAGLATWQLQRLSWKQALLQQIEGAQAEEPLPYIPDETALPDVKWRKVEIRGTYLYDKTLHFVGRQSGGYYLLTPFQLLDGRHVLINRGWASQQNLDARGPATLTVTGILREPRPKRLFSPPNHPERNSWFIEDIAAMEQVTGLRLMPAIIDATGPKNEHGWPILNDGKITLRNDHFGYAITWFALAIVALVMGAAYHLERKPENGA